MQNYYRINVAKDRRYLFATEQGGLTYEAEAMKVFLLLKEKFPESEGYEVTVTHWKSCGIEQKW